MQTAAHEIILISPSICDWDTFGTVGAIPISARLTSTCISVSLISFNAPDTTLMVNTAHTLLFSSRCQVGMVKISESPLLSKVQCSGTESALSSLVDECAKPQYFRTWCLSKQQNFGRTLGKSLMMLLPVTEAAAGNMLKSLQYLVYMSYISVMKMLSLSWVVVKLNASLKWHYVIHVIYRKICHHMKEVGRKVAVTATTGLASQQYRDFGGTTVHKWAGLNWTFYKGATSFWYPEQWRIHPSKRKHTGSWCASNWWNWNAQEEGVWHLRACGENGQRQQHYFWRHADNCFWLFQAVATSPRSHARRPWGFLFPKHII